MLTFITLAMALAPSLLLVWYFHSRDLRPEPGRAIWATFGLGMLIPIPVLIAAAPWALLVAERLSDPLAGGTADAFLVAAIPEETAKFVVLWGFARRRREFDEPMDGIVYGVMASLGFATVENVLYSASGGIAVALFRAFTAVPIHGFIGALMGYLVGVAHFGPPERRRAMIRQALFWPIVLHGLYDFPLLTIKRMAGTTKVVTTEQALGLLAFALVSLAVVVVTVVLGVKLVRRMRRAQRLALALAEGKAGDADDAKDAEAVRLAALWPVASEEVPEEPVPATASEPRRSRGAAWAFLIPGGLLVTLGGLFVLGLIGALTAGTAKDPVGAVIGGAVIAAPLLVGGILLFRAGLRRLPRPIRVSVPPGFSPVPGAPPSPGGSPVPPSRPIGDSPAASPPPVRVPPEE